MRGLGPSSTKQDVPRWICPFLHCGPPDAVTHRTRRDWSLLVVNVRNVVRVTKCHTHVNNYYHNQRARMVSMWNVTARSCCLLVIKGDWKLHKRNHPGPESEYNCLLPNAFIRTLRSSAVPTWTLPDRSDRSRLSSGRKDVWDPGPWNTQPQAMLQHRHHLYQWQIQELLMIPLQGGHKHTHTRLTALCPGLPRWARTRKVKPIWILVKQETVSGSGISWAICKSAPCSRQTTTPAPHRFLQAGCPCCRPTNSVKALNVLTKVAHKYIFNKYQRVNDK